MMIFSLHVVSFSEGVPDTYPVMDDLKVQGKTKLEHDIDVLQTYEFKHMEAVWDLIPASVS